MYIPHDDLEEDECYKKALITGKKNRRTSLAILDRFVAAIPASCLYESYLAAAMLTMALLGEQVEVSVLTFF